MSETLKPCPFCGGEAVLIEPNEHWSFYHVYCVNECCIGWKSIEASFFVADEAITAWNTRVELGSGTCHMSFIDEYETASGEEEYLCECSECGYRRWEHAHDLPLFCSKCGKKVN